MLKDVLRLSPAELGLAEDDPVAVFLVNVDRFRPVNDALGFDAGDELLRRVGLRVQDWGGSDAVVVRIGGARFVAVVPRIRDGARAEVEGERLRILLAEPTRIGSEVVARNVSIGYAVARPSEIDTAGLYQRADSALAAAQHAGGNLAVGFSEYMRARAVARAQLELQLADALRQDQLRLFYQPEVDLRSGALLAVEALTRWNHPVLGLLGAATFMHVAERIGVIRELDTWALHQACRQLADWLHRFPEERLVVRVNMSPTHLADAQTPQTVRDALDESGLSGTRLCIEVTELVDIPRPEAAVQVLTELRAMGVTIAIDDFGVGHSSLLRLKELPVDAVKIDRAFVARLGRDRDDLAIVTGLIQLAATLGLDLVAEGVEDPTAAAELLRLGCWRAQGDGLAPAMPPERLTEILAAGARVDLGPPAT